MGYGNTIPTDGRPQGAMSVHSRIQGGAMATGGLLVLVACALLNAAVLGDSDTSGSLWFGVLVGLYMLAYGIVKRLSLTILPRPGAGAGSSREHHPAD
ncbi:hypothetical protein [Arthrobacter sp.]|uniref:hypothetical protein n=1 Tax=Arthrobacter sp. TaxID=1667 RepID=UPI003A953889